MTHATEADRRTAGIILRDQLAEHPHHCEQSRHLPVRHRDGSRSLRCCDCGAQVRLVPVVEGGQGRADDEIERGAWTAAALVLAILLAMAAWLVLG